MPDGMSVCAAECTDTQLHTIRDLMFSAARRGAWLTLGEIARLTEFGEASISAQLRHLRKLRHGRHRVEKRLRFEREAGANEKRRRGEVATTWEYRVWPPGWPGKAQPEAVLPPGGESDAKAGD